MGVAEGNVGLAFGLVIMAGLSTTFGSAFVFCSSYANTRLLAGALGISAGVMLYVSFGEIFSVKAIEGFADGGYSDNAALRLATLCFFSGIVLTFILDAIVHKIGEIQKQKYGAKAPVCAGCDDIKSGELGEITFGKSAASPSAAGLGAAAAVKAAGDNAGSPSAGSLESASPRTRSRAAMMHAASTDALVEMQDDGEVVDVAGVQPQEMTAGADAMVDMAPPQAEAEREALKNMGLLTGLAIGLHNFPEGLATFVAALADSKLGIALALAIAVHNIPEGICVAMPVYYATGSKWKGFFWSFVSGVSEPIGGLFGYLILYGNAMSSIAYGALFGVVGGMMVYISLKELLPTALKYDPEDKIVTNCMFVGMLIMALSLILFAV